MAVQFKKATKQAARLRMALIGPAGSGKTYTGLQLASLLGGPVAVIDSERGSASKYADLFAFDSLELESYHPQTYIDAIKAAEAGGYEVLLVDSLSHAWSGKEGALELVDRAAARSQSKNSFSAWREVTPLHNALVDAILGCRMHVIGTMRTKTEYVMEKDDRGKTAPKKIGLQPVQRDGLEYEFDVIGDMDIDNNLIVGKTRCPQLSGKVYKHPGKELADILRSWLGTGKAITPEQAAELDGLIKEVGADRKKFCEFFHVQKVEDVQAADFVKAQHMLASKRKAGSKPFPKEEPTTKGGLCSDAQLREINELATAIGWDFQDINEAAAEQVEGCQIVQDMTVLQADQFIAHLKKLREQVLASNS